MTDKQVTYEELVALLRDGVKLLPAHELDDLLTEAALLEAEAEVSEAMAMTDGTLIARVLQDQQVPVTALEVTMRYESLLTDYELLTHRIAVLEAQLYAQEHPDGDDA